MYNNIVVGSGECEYDCECECAYELVSEVMHLWHYEVLFNVMAYLLTSQRTTWYYKLFFDVMTYFVDLINIQYSLREGK